MSETNTPRDPFQASREAILNTVLIGASVISLFVTITFYFVTSFWTLGLMVILTAGAASMAYRTDWPYRTRVTYLLVLIYAIGVQDLIFVGLLGDGRSTFIVLVLLASLFLGRTAGLTSFGFTILTVVGTAVGTNILPKNPATQELYITAQGWRLTSLYLAVLGFVTLAAVRKLFNDTAEAILQETELIGELEKERNLSEERIANRAQALQTSTEISHSISNLLDPQELIKVVLEQIRSGFGYYHVQLYHLDLEAGYLHLVGSTGEKGEALMTRKHKIAIGRGIVGQTALTNQPIVAPDVRQLDAWLPNPELPDTQAELAVPFGGSGMVRGVLDVQQNHPNSLNQDDVYVLQVIADQLAVALQNAQQYAQIQERTQREQFLSNLQSQIQAAKTPTEVMHTAAQHLAQALQIPRIAIELGELPER